MNSQQARLHVLPELFRPPWPLLLYQQREVNNPSSTKTMTTVTATANPKLAKFTMTGKTKT
jgi:hypothetical protein